MLTLSDVEGPERAGGKAAGLAALAREGFPVPAGVVIPPGAPVDTDAILQRLGARGPVAVRSSGVGEDGATTSLAGVYDSVLDVVGARELDAAVARVRASAAGPRAVAARVERAPLAVLVQVQVAARASGVAFTADPVTGSRRVVVIGVVPGTGVALVDGTTEGDEWRVVEDRVVPVRDRLGVLDPTRAAAIASLARRVEAARGGPQDVEWAWDGSDLWVLQARPMTGLPTPPRRRGRLGRRA